MKWLVSFKDVKKEVEVEAEDRWGAVVEAVELLKFDTRVPIRYWFSIASVKKVERKKRKAFWEK